MNKIILVSLLCFPLAAFAKDKIDPNCQKVANIAEGLAKVRDVGYTIKQLDAFVSEPTVQVFPIDSLKNYVYSLDKPADQLAKDVYTSCTNLGFDVFNKFLLQSDELKTANFKIDFLEKRNKELEKEIEDLKLENLNLKVKKK